MGSRLLELFYFQVLILETLHADPHWGNYLFNDDGTIGLVDFGCVKRLGSDVVGRLRQSFLYPGRFDSPEFQRIVQEQFGEPRQEADARRAACRRRFRGALLQEGVPARSEGRGAGVRLLRPGLPSRLPARGGQADTRQRRRTSEYIFLVRAEESIP